MNIRIYEWVMLVLTIAMLWLAYEAYRKSAPAPVRYEWSVPLVAPDRYAAVIIPKQKGPQDGPLFQPLTRL